RNLARRRSGVGREQAPRLAAIRGDLCLQSIESVKLLLRAQIVDQRHPQMPPIEIAAPVEEIDLEDEVGAADGRAIAEAGDAVMPDGPAPLVDAGLAGVDAGCRLEILGEHQVRRGVAEVAPQLLAVLDPALDLPRASEQ